MRTRKLFVQVCVKPDDKDGEQLCSRGTMQVTEQRFAARDAEDLDGFLALDRDLCVLWKEEVGHQRQVRGGGMFCAVLESDR